MAKIDKLLEQARPHLEPGEEVLAAVQGNYEVKVLGSDTVRAGVLIATPDRIVFYAKKLGGYDLESFAYRNVSSFEQSKNMMGHVITFFASGNKVSMKWIPDPKAMEEFVVVVKSKLLGGSASAAASSQATNAPVGGEDLMDAIRKLGELHQEGILTDEEFSTKKAELLARL